MEKTYRYNLSDQMKAEIIKFAVIHENDERKDFKESWEEWIIKKEDNIKSEVQSHVERGYKGGKEGLERKMFVSVRYYHRKKARMVKPETKKRKEYERLPKEMHIDMERYINSTLNEDMSPSASFDKYMSLMHELLEKEDVSKYNKMKKAYKNKINIFKKRL